MNVLQKPRWKSFSYLYSDHGGKKKKSLNRPSWLLAAHNLNHPNVLLFIRNVTLSLISFKVHLAFSLTFTLNVLYDVWLHSECSSEFANHCIVNIKHACCIFCFLLCSLTWLSAEFFLGSRHLLSQLIRTFFALFSF